MEIFFDCFKGEAHLQSTMPPANKNKQKEELAAIEALRAAMSKIGKIYGRKGGRNRAESLSPERRQEIARLGGLARAAEWRKANKKKG